jgi:hypothetical protein
MEKPYFRVWDDIKNDMVDRLKSNKKKHANICRNCI